MPKKLRMAGSSCHLKVRTLKVNALGGAEYDVLLEESASSNKNIINDDCTIMILWDFVTCRYFIVHYCFLE
jgi:hypothetical protein